MAPVMVKRRKISHSPEQSDDDVPGKGSSASQGLRSAQRRNVVSNIVTNPVSKSPNGEIPHHPSSSRSMQAATDDLLLSQSSHRSSLLKLQLDELLAEVRPDFQRLTARVKSTLERLKEIIEAIPKGPQRSLIEAEKELKKSGVIIPFPDPRPSKDVKHKVEYYPAIDINVVGNFALKLGAKVSGLNSVDLAIVLPPQSFQEKDYLNHRYFHKRAYFVATFAAAIKEAAKDEFNLAFENQDDVELQPCLLVTPGKKASRDFVKSKCQIRIITAVSDDVFPLEKTNISKNCVRPKGSADESTSLKPTPSYNSYLRSEASVTAYLRLLSKACSTCEAFRDASLLAGTWLNQRGYGSRGPDGGFGTFEFVLICALLLEGGGPKDKPVFSPRYNSHQLFQGVLRFLAGRDLREPLVIGPFSANIPKGAQPVLYDAYRGVNVMNKMQAWSYDLLRHDAKATLDALNLKLSDNFEAAFISKVNDSTLRFDQTACIDLTSANDNLFLKDTYNRLYEVLQRGLGDRAHLIHLRTLPSKPWALKAKSASLTSARIEVGFLLDPETINRLVDRGPLAEEKEAAESFRKFWGEKAELRRFNDGTISESLVWSGTDEGPVVQQIMMVLLPLHLNLPPSAIAFAVNQAERQVGISDAQKSFQTYIETFQSFSSKLHSLEGLPLNIRSLSAADESLCFSSLHDPLKNFHPANIVVQFEGSVRWPDALTAIQRTKIAFLTKIGDLLESSNDPLPTRVGLENTHSNLLNVAFLDVFFSNGVVFRLRIHHEREQTLLERQLQNRDLSGRDRDLTAQALLSYKHLYTHSPAQTAAVRALCTRFPALSITIRFLKKWTSSHLITPFFAPELLELLCAYVFLCPQPWTTPSTPLTAFLRVLVLISKWDWPTDPLILDLGSDMTSADIATMHTKFQAWRKVDPAMNNAVLSFATNLDPTGVIWTQGSRPPKVVATRLTALAQAAVSTIRDQGLNLDVPSLFSSPLTHFDFLIHLKSTLRRSSARHTKNASSQFKNLQLDIPATTRDPETVGYDPIQLYINDLSAAFSSSIVLFFYDGDGGDVIAGLWNPRTVKEDAIDFRVRAGVNVKPSTGEEGKEDGEGPQEEGQERGNKVVVNKEAMLSEMAQLGQGIVERVQILPKD